MRINEPAESPNSSEPTWYAWTNLFRANAR
jgi:hypothetical protein